MEALAPAVGVVAGANVVVQALERKERHEDAAVPVNDGLGQAGGAAGIHHPQRVVKRQPVGLESGHGRVVAGSQGVEVVGVGHALGGKPGAHHHHLLQRGQGRAQFADGGTAVERLAGIKHAIGCNQGLGLDLFEAVEHGGRAHVGGTHAPHRANAGAGQKRNHGFGHVGQVGGHPVAPANAQLAQAQRQRRHLALQLGPARLAHAAGFVFADDGQHAGRVGRRHVTHHLAGVVDLRALEPFDVGHGASRQHRTVRRGRRHLEVIPDALPEGRQVGGGPAPQRVVTVEMLAALFGQPLLVQAQAGDKRGMMERAVHGGQA